MNREFHFEPFARLMGLLQGVVVLIVTGSAIVLTGCAANQQMASTGTSPQEEQDRAVCLQHAHRDSGYNEKTFASCMTAKDTKEITVSKRNGSRRGTPADQRHIEGYVEEDGSISQPRSE
jgi:hypothetical protein